MASASSGNESAETGLPQEFRTGDVRLRASERARTGLRLGRWEGSRAKETNRDKSQLSGPAGGAHYTQPGRQARPPRRSGPACRPPVVAVGGGRRTSEAGARNRIPTRGGSAEAGVIRLGGRGRSYPCGASPRPRRAGRKGESGLEWHGTVPGEGRWRTEGTPVPDERAHRTSRHTETRRNSYTLLTPNSHPSHRYLNLIGGVDTAGRRYPPAQRFGDARSTRTRGTCPSRSF